MTDKRYLFRGFHPNVNGNTTITLNGKKIKGEWVYGDLIHRQIWASSLTIIRESDDGFDNYEEYQVIPETVGQFVNTDKNGKDLFDSDIVRFIDKYGAKPKSSGLAKIEWHKYGFNLNGSYDEGLIKGTIIWIHMTGDMEYELVGNKWECAE